MISIMLIPVIILGVAGLVVIPWLIVTLVRDRMRKRTEAACADAALRQRDEDARREGEDRAV